MKNNYLLFFLLTSFFSSSQTINIPDPVFKAKLLNSQVTFNSGGSPIHLDGNNDGEIQIEEAQLLYGIDFLSDMNGVVTDLSGIENFINLTYLNVAQQEITEINLPGLNNLLELHCDVNNITDIDISHLQNLVAFSCSFNQLTSLDFQNNALLEKISADNNPLTSININGLTNLKELYCSTNQLSSLDASDLTSLIKLFCYETNISSLNLTGLVNLEELRCYKNALTSLDFTGLNNLKSIVCHNNNLPALDLSDCSNLEELYCYSNKLISLDISQNHFLHMLAAFQNLLEYVNLRNGIPSSFLMLSNNPNLEFVCIDENENEEGISFINQNYPDCVVSTNCALHNTDFDFEKNISLYPNPSSSIINLKLRGELVIQSLEVYNIIGQIVMSIPNANNTSALNIASLASGTYILKVITDRGTANSKFIKK